MDFKKVLTLASPFPAAMKGSEHTACDPRYRTYLHLGQGLLFLASHLLLAASSASDVVMSPTFGFIVSTCSSQSPHWSHSQGSWGSPPHFLWAWQESLKFSRLSSDLQCSRDFSGNL